MARYFPFSVVVPHFSVGHPLALAIASVSLSLPVMAADAAIGVQVVAESAQDIPAGSLSRALSLFAARVGVALTFDPALTEGLSSSGLKGNYPIREGFSRLLEGTGLEVTSKAGGYTLRQRLAASKSVVPSVAPVELTDVVVVGSRAPQQISEIPGTVWVIDQQQIEAQTRAGVPLKEALGLLVPGLDIGPQGRTNYGQNMRGRSVLVMIDGVSLNSSRGISRQFDAIDPFNIERIEVLSGASAVYGGGATGGIINIITKRAHDPELAFSTEIGVRSGLEHSDDHDVRLAQSISGGTEQVRGRLGVSLQQNEAAYDSHGRQIKTDITQTDLQYNRTVDVLGTLDIALPAEQSLRLSAQYYDSGYEGDRGLYLGPNLSGALGNPALLEMRKGFTSDVVPKTERQMVTADYHAPAVLGGQDLYLQVYARQEKMDFHPFPGRITIAGLGSLNYYGSSSQNTDDIGLKLALAKSWSGFSMTYGLDLNRESFDAEQTLFNTATAFASGGLVNRQSGTVGRYPEYSLRGISGFFQSDWKVRDDLTLSAGVRQQRVNVAIDDFVQVNQQVLIANGLGSSADAIPGGKNHYSVTLANAGAVYKLSPAQQVWLNYSEGFELPDPAKYYGQGTYTLVGGKWTLGNSINVKASPLTGIKTRQVELGWRRQQDGWKLQTSAFYALSDKNIVTNTTNLTIDVEDKDKRNYGLEGEVSWRAPEGLELGANALLIRSQVKNQGSWDRQQVTEASPDKAVLFAGWRGTAMAARLQATHLRDVEDSTGASLKGYTTVDLLTSYQKGSWGKVSFGIQNLLDKDYTTSWSQRAKLFYGALLAPATFDFPGRGRTYALTWSQDY